MKRLNFYLSMLLMMVIAVGCNDKFDMPPLAVPTADLKPNITIAELKAKYWQDARNYIDTIKEDLVIHGWVTSSDESGNIYKSLYISDGTAGLSISINGNSLNTTYRVGQEIVINLKDKFIGKYNGQQQLGYPAWYEAGKAWEATFLSLEMWESMVQLNGLPEPERAEVQPEVVKISDFQGKTDKETLLKYQGKLIRINGVKFPDADGSVPYSEADKTTNRNIQDADGNVVILRNSNYANFRAEALPMGEGDVIGLLSFYGADTWQLYIRSTDDCIGFSTDTKGTEKDPYTIAEALAAKAEGKSISSKWFRGYAVGAVAPEKTSVSSNADIEFTAPTTLANTLVIADSPNETDFAKCLIIALPDGTALRNQANLRDNESVYKTAVMLKGDLGTFMGTNAITGNSGDASEFKLTVVSGGVTELSEGFDSGLPADWQNIKVKGDKAWYQTTYQNNGYAAMTGYKGTAPFESWLITPAIDIKNAPNKILSFRTQVNGYGSTTTTMKVYLLDSNDPTMATKIELPAKFATAPASGYSDWAASGDIDLSSYPSTYFIGWCYAATADANFATWCVDDVKFGEGGGDTPGPGPGPQPTNATRADFETFNGGEATGYYKTFTSTAGWVMTNCSLLSGGPAGSSNPQFEFIGFRNDLTDQYAFAPTLNGKTSSVGTLVSPTITGGIKKIYLQYGLAFSDTAISFRIDIKQNGQTVWTHTETPASPVKQTAYSLEKEITGVTGDYTIEITNLSPSGQDANKDRVSIWNLHWDK